MNSSCANLVYVIIEQTIKQINILKMSESCNDNVGAENTPVILKSPLENLLSDDILSSANDWQKMLMAACYSVVDNFSLFIDPFKHQKKTFFPSQKIMRNDDILRRTPDTKQKMFRGKN